MIKRFLIILILILFIPFIVNAKEYCLVETGNLNTIGSEIACGNEHFYIIDSNDNEIKMLGKYNLYVGTIFDKIKLDINETYIKIKCKDVNCNNVYFNDTTYYFEGNQVRNFDEWESKIKSKYKLNDLITSYGNNGNKYSDGSVAIYSYIYGEPYTEGGETYKKSTYKLYPYESITGIKDEYALQNELARGVTGEKGNANYPIYGILTLFPDGNGLSSYISNFNSLSSFENGFTNFEFRADSLISNYLNDYFDNLNNKGYKIEDADMVTVEDINNIVYNVTKKSLPLSNWYELSKNIDSTEEDGNKYKTLGDLKDYLSNDYAWLWNTSYWTKTLVGNVDEIEDSTETNAYFISSSGEICFSESDCFSGIPRAGIRPVVTISKDNIKYNIRTKTDGNGTIEVIDSAFGGESISFRVSAKKGLRLAGLIIKTDSGEVVEFSEEDLTTNSDGTIRISTNKFTMPYENVLIEARWTLDILNPKTGAKILLIIFVLSITIFLSIKVFKIKKKN